MTADFGFSTDLPVIGDWNGDGCDEISVWTPSEQRFFLDTNGNYAWDAGTDLTASFGYSTDLLPIAGDWNNDGFDDIGVSSPRHAPLLPGHQRKLRLGYRPSTSSPTLVPAPIFQ